MSYISGKTKRVVPARSIGQPCNCSQKCFKKLIMNLVEVIFSNFWDLTDYNLEKSYLSDILKWDDC